MSELSRKHELLADLAVAGLEADEQQELDELGDDDLSFELAAAAADLALFGETEAMPDLVAKRIENAASTASQVAPRSRTGLIAGWAVAALCAGLLLFVVLRKGPVNENQPSISERRAALLASGDAKRTSWAPGPDALGAGVKGDVVWSDKSRTGFMRFVGLRPNDPSELQYQLWIFDPARDERYPIDGGVFDISSDGEVVVPIDAKLPLVADASLFVVTVERPGGVVVSDRSRIAALAKVEN